MILIQFQKSLLKNVIYLYVLTRIYSEIYSVYTKIKNVLDKIVKSTTSINILQIFNVLNNIVA